MISFTFSVSPDQGDPSGFDLGHMTCTGEQGSADSRGHVPDQGMMIYIAVADLLYGVRLLLEGRSSRFGFVGTDSSFTLIFRRNKKGISVATRDGVIARPTGQQLASELLTAARRFAGEWVNVLPEDDAAKADLRRALADFEQAFG